MPLGVYIVDYKEYRNIDSGNAPQYIVFSIMLYLCILLYIYVLLYLSSMYIQSIHIPAYLYSLWSLYTGQTMHHIAWQSYMPVCHIACIAYTPYSHVYHITYALISSVLQYVCIGVYSYMHQQYMRISYNMYQQHIASYSI